MVVYHYSGGTQKSLSLALASMRESLARLAGGGVRLLYIHEPAWAQSGRAYDLVESLHVDSKYTNVRHDEREATPCLLSASLLVKPDSGCAWLDSKCTAHHIYVTR